MGHCLVKYQRPLGLEPPIALMLSKPKAKVSLLTVYLTALSLRPFGCIVNQPAHADFRDFKLTII